MTYRVPEIEDKNIIFIGHGIEGKSFEKFIETHAIHIQSFRYIDQQDNPDYLDKLKNIDQESTVVIKSPGVPGRFVDQQDNPEYPY